MTETCPHFVRYAQVIVSFQGRQSVGVCASGGALVLLLCGVLSCSASTSAPGGATTGTAALDSTFPFMPAHYSASAATTQSDPNHVAIVVTSLRDVDSCAATRTSAAGGVANAFRLVVTLERTDLNPVFGPGTYPLGEGWQASYQHTDATCATAEGGVANKGFLQIDSPPQLVGSSSIQGVADVTFSAGRVIASFDALFCGSSAATSAGGFCSSLPACPGQGTAPETNAMCNELP
jgi:hypothetical protein